MTDAEGLSVILARLDALEEIGHLMHETVLVTDLQPGYPPLAHIRMIPIRHVNRPPAAHSPFIAVLKVLQSV